MQTHSINKIFCEAISSVHPELLLPQYIKVQNGILSISGNNIQIEQVNKLHILACGKAASAMACAAEHILGDLIDDGICITKYSHSLPLNRLTIIESAHPFPDQSSLAAGKMVSRKFNALHENDVVIALFSGGASSLIADAPGSCTIEDIQYMNTLLVNSGAPIQDINIIRKHVSNLKGGQLSKLIYPATVFALLISDVPGDRPEDIGSGLTVADPSTYDDAFMILEKYDLLNKIPISVLQHLNMGKAGLIEETPKPGSNFFSNTFNTIIASNLTALDSAAVSATQAGFYVKQMTELMQRNVMQTAVQISDSLLEYYGNLPCCFLWGGETTIKITGKGYGGRNQHLALCTLGELKKKWNRPEKFTILCGGTDGTDGPTNAAGAIINSDMLEQKKITNDLIKSFLTEFNSNAFFKEFGTLLLTGPTQTNVMDIVIAIIE